MKQVIIIDHWLNAFEELAKIKPAAAFTGRLLSKRVSGKELLAANIKEFKEAPANEEESEKTITVLATSWYVVKTKELRNFPKVLAKIKKSSKTIDDFNTLCSNLYTKLSK